MLAILFIVIFFQFLVVRSLLLSRIEFAKRIFSKNIHHYHKRFVTFGFKSIKAKSDTLLPVISRDNSWIKRDEYIIEQLAENESEDDEKILDAPLFEDENEEESVNENGFLSKVPTEGDFPPLNVTSSRSKPQRKVKDDNVSTKEDIADLNMIFKGSKSSSSIASIDKEKKLNQEGFEKDTQSISFMTIKEISDSYHFSQAYLVDLVQELGVTGIINIDARLGDIMTGEQIFQLLQALNTLDPFEINIEYDPSNSLLSLAESWNISMEDLITICKQEQISLPDGIETILHSSLVERIKAAIDMQEEKTSSLLENKRKNAILVDAEVQMSDVFDEGDEIVYYDIGDEYDDELSSDSDESEE